MFFDRGNGGSQDVHLNEIRGMANRFLNQKLAQLEEKGSAITGGFGEYRKQFLSACVNLEKLNAEPDTEDIYIQNTSSLSSQKSAYAKSLMRIMEDYSEIAEAENVYRKYESVLSSMESIINSIMKSNNAFRLPFLAYSKYLGDFKKIFAGMERLTASLKMELERNRGKFMEYENIVEEVNKLLGLDAEISDMEDNIKRLESDSSAGASEDAGIIDIGKEISKKREELAQAREKLSSLSSRLTHTLSPLERIARKYDHEFGKKRRLSEMIKNPKAEIASESDYNEMILLVKDMESAINSGKIDVRNDEGIRAAISRVLSADIYPELLVMKDLKDKEIILSGEISSYERILIEAEKEKNRASHYGNVVYDMKRNLETMEKTRQAAKHEIERYFLAYYKKKVNVILE
jgi:DNA repair exonuclease SbcCD ATPase subunit